MMPDFPFVQLQQAGLELLAARRALGRGKSPEELLGRAAAAAARGLKLDPQDAQLVCAQAEVHRWRGGWLQSRGLPSRDEIAQGLGDAGKALSMKPDLADAAVIEGALHLLSARDERERAARAAAARRACVAFERAFGINPLLERRDADLAAEAARMAGGG